MWLVALGHVLREKIGALLLGRCNFWVSSTGNDLVPVCTEVTTTFHFLRLQNLVGVLLVSRQK